MKREGPSLTHYAQPECVRIYGYVHALRSGAARRRRGERSTREGERRSGKR